MVAFIIFLITFAQGAGVIASYLLQMKPVFGILFVQASPVMVFFGGIDIITDFGGEISFFFWPALAYCVVKYALMALSLKNDELGFLNVSALCMEVLYVAASSYYIVTNSYF